MSQQPTLSGFYNLFFVNEQLGFVECRSQLALTIDGGKSWRIKSLPTNRASTIFFVDATTGFYSDDSGTGLWKTIDSGNTWKVVLNHSGMIYYPYFFNADSGFVVSSDNFFYSTTDGGLNWHADFKPGLNANSTTISYNQLFFIDHLTGYYANSNGVFQTMDGGFSWQQSLKSNDISFVNVIRFEDAHTGYYKGISAIYKTTDGGITWKVDCKLGSNGFIGMSMPDAHHGWACTGDGRILNTKDQ